jgi:hypothetical protein
MREVHLAPLHERGQRENDAFNRLSRLILIAQLPERLPVAFLSNCSVAAYLDPATRRRHRTAQFAQRRLRVQSRQRHLGPARPHRLRPLSALRRVHGGGARRRALRAGGRHRRRSSSIECRCEDLTRREGSDVPLRVAPWRQRDANRGRKSPPKPVCLISSFYTRFHQAQEDEQGVPLPS